MYLIFLQSVRTFQNDRDVRVSFMESHSYDWFRPFPSVPIAHPMKDWTDCDYVTQMTPLTLAGDTIQLIDLICGTLCHGPSKNSFKYPFQTKTSVNWNYCNLLVHQRCAVRLVSFEWTRSVTRCCLFSLDLRSYVRRTLKNCISSLGIPQVDHPLLLSRRPANTAITEQLCSIFFRLIHQNVLSTKKKKSSMSLIPLRSIFLHCCFSSVKSVNVINASNY